MGGFPCAPVVRESGVATRTSGQKPQPDPVFSLGDHVEIMHFGTGRITALRGPLGPSGEQVYRVIYRRKPKAGYIEVLGNQIRPIKAKRQHKPGGKK